MDDEPTKAETDISSDLRENKAKNSFHDGLREFKDISPDEPPIYMVHDLWGFDSRVQESEIFRAKPVEVEGICQRKVYEKVAEKDVPQHVNIVGGRFLLRIITFATTEEITKAGYIT